jgi:murein L,D-transpeptidase YafK
MVTLSRLRSAALLAAVGLAGLTLAACTDYAGNLPKHLRPLSSATRALIEDKGMDQDAPILIRIFKEESVFEVWKKQRQTGRFALLKTYDICRWSGDLGPKKAEGDRQAPEGFYTITPAQMNPNSHYYLSFNIGYPNDYDRSLGRTGSAIMVHGACSSRGCYSMDDDQIQEIYTLARLAFQGGQRNFQVQAFPFRMTPENMALHLKDPNIDFWRMLKEGYDHFEVTRQQPKIDVCSKRYVFDSVPQAGVTFSPTGECPPMTMPDEIRVAVADKEAKDNEETMVIAAKLEAKEEREAEKGWSKPATMLASATATSPDGAPMSVATAPVSLEPATVASIAPQKAAPEPTAKAVADAAPDAGPRVPEPRPVALASTAAPGADQPAEMATAYAPEEKSGIGGFFTRIIDKVNPF